MIACDLGNFQRLFVLWVQGLDFLESHKEMLLRG